MRIQEHRSIQLARHEFIMPRGVLKYDQISPMRERMACVPASPSKQAIRCYAKIIGEQARSRGLR